VGFVVMVLLGEWFCVRRELQDIPLSEWNGAAVQGLVLDSPAVGQLQLRAYSQIVYEACHCISTVILQHT
jgi:hypothetical protein